MNTFWLKAAALVVVIVGVFLVVNKIQTKLKERPAPPPEKTLGDVIREDEKRLRAEPNVPPPAPPAASQAVSEQQAPKFAELTEEQKTGAEEIFEWAIKSREMAHLPGVGYGKMVEACRNIIERYPGSEFDYKARRMLGEVPQREWERFHITQEEIDGPKQ